MFPGFDDRFEAKISAKQWLAEHSHSDFTVQNLLKISRDLVLQNREPTDDRYVELRERSTGVLIGVMEYAEELARGIGAKSSSVIRKAKMCIPGRITEAQLLLCEAEATLNDEIGEQAVRCVKAIRLARAIADIRVERKHMSNSLH